MNRLRIQRCSKRLAKPHELFELPRPLFCTPGIAGDRLRVALDLLLLIGLPNTLMHQDDQQHECHGRDYHQPTDPARRQRSFQESGQRFPEQHRGGAN